MCLAVPARLIEVRGKTGRMELEGNEREVDLSFIEDPRAGDWVLVHAGFAIEKMDAEEAEETLRMLAEMRGENGDSGQG